MSQIDAGGDLSPGVHGPYRITTGETMSLKQWLQDNGETYEKFAERLHISVPFLCNILSGKQANIKIDLLLRMSKLTKFDCGELAEELMKKYNDYHVQQLQLQEDKNKEPL